MERECTFLCKFRNSTQGVYVIKLVKVMLSEEDNNDDILSKIRVMAKINKTAGKEFLVSAFNIEDLKDNTYTFDVYV